MKLLNLIN